MIKLGITDDLSVSITDDNIYIEKDYGHPLDKPTEVILTTEEFDHVVVAVKNMRAMMEGLKEGLGE